MSLCRRHPRAGLILHQDLSRPSLQALTTSSYATAAPPKFRPYRSNVNGLVSRRDPVVLHLLTPSPVARTTSTANDIIQIDNTYRSRLAYRRHLLSTQPEETYGHLSAASWSISEFYTYLFSHHLPTRFPLHFSASPSGTLVQNNTTENSFPVIAQSAANALRAIGENVDEDFVMLLPSAEGWRVGAFVTGFPTGLRLGEKLGWQMRKAQKVEPGYDSVLTKLAPGVTNGMTRMNWSIARTDELYTPNGAHCYEGEEECEDATISADECCLRVERQTMWKLPGTGAVIWGIKTYIYRLNEIKAEAGEAERLARSIEHLGGEMGRFSAGTCWGNQVLEYLRS